MRELNKINNFLSLNPRIMFLSPNEKCGYTEFCPFKMNGPSETCYGTRTDRNQSFTCNIFNLQRFLREEMTYKE